MPTSPGRLASPAIVLLIAGVPIVLKTAMGRWQEAIRAMVARPGGKVAGPDCSPALLATLPAPAVRLSR